MDKRFLNITSKYIIYLEILLLSFVCGKLNKRGENTNHSKMYSLISHPVVHENADSIRIFVYFHIPYSSLQFVKEKSGFRAEYEASLSVLSKQGIQKYYRVWSDSISVDKYAKTTSSRLSVILMTEFPAIPEEIHLESNVMDLDNRNIFEQTDVLNLAPYVGEFLLFPPIILVDREGSWGFVNGKIPTHSKMVREIGNELTIFISGRIQPEEVKIMTVLNSKGEGNLWKEEQSFQSDSKHFSDYQNIPDSVFNGIKYSMKTFLIQRKKSISKTIHFSLKKSGISEFITDIDEAIEQMRYILENEEKTELKKSKRKNREMLFRSFWENRDPSPKTLRNELMDEYYRRVNYANEHFKGFQPGWETDMGMIYILFGIPDDVERTNDHHQRKVYESWHYFKINKDFVFVDENGFGDFRLKTPYFGYPR